MRKINKIYFRTVFSLLAGILIFSGANAQNITALKIGDKATMTEHKVEDTSGRSLSIAEAAGDNGVMVIFSCNTCPWVAKWEDRYNGLANVAEQNKIGVIALNPNERIRDKGESMEDMRKRAQKSGYNFPYAMDKDHLIADAFGATRTPEIFIFNKDMVLMYHGAIDDNANSASDVKIKYTENALKAISAGSAVSESETRSLGCTIKRVK